MIKTINWKKRELQEMFWKLDSNGNSPVTTKAHRYQPLSEFSKSFWEFFGENIDKCSKHKYVGPRKKGRTQFFNCTPGTSKYIMHIKVHQVLLRKLMDKGLEKT